MSNIARIIVFPNSDHLCSVRYKDEVYEDDEEGELRRLLRCWQDADHLTDFYETHKKDLRDGFYSGTDFASFLDRTDKAALDFQQRIWAAITTNTATSLETLFRPLDNLQEERDRYQRMKARSYEPNGWLRLYALRTIDDTYIVTGGAIKLTHRMERPHLQRELEKMAAIRKQMSKYLRDDDFYTLYSLLHTSTDL